MVLGFRWVQFSCFGLAITTNQTPSIWSSGTAVPRPRPRMPMTAGNMETTGRRGGRRRRDWLSAALRASRAWRGEVEVGHNIDAPNTLVQHFKNCLTI